MIRAKKLLLPDNRIMILRGVMMISQLADVAQRSPEYSGLADEYKCVRRTAEVRLAAKCRVEVCK